MTLLRSKSLGAVALLAAALCLSPGCASSEPELVSGRCSGMKPSFFHQCCAGAWTDVRTSAEHCGECGESCNAMTSCIGGTCSRAPDDGGVTLDGAPRADASVDRGECSPGCTTGQDCCSGVCVARNGVATGADGRNDPSFENCGACGDDCDPQTASACSSAGSAGATCRCGAYPACSTGQVCVLNTSGAFWCVNLLADPNNCGEIGHVCALGESCVSGECDCASAGRACGSGETCCESGCVAADSDERNCGECGHRCAPGETCSSGTCRCGETTCQGPLELLPGSGILGCGEICCANSCILPNAANCNGCGDSCGSGEACGVGIADFLIALTTGNALRTSCGIAETEDRQGEVVDCRNLSLLAGLGDLPF